MVEITRILRNTLLFVGLIFSTNISFAQQPEVRPRIAGLENNEEYMSLLHKDIQLQNREDSVAQAIRGLRKQLLQESAEKRQTLSREILHLENAMFEIRNTKGQLVDRINTIEQEWLLANLETTNQAPAAAANRFFEVPDSLKVRNLIDNLCFRKQLPQPDYIALQRAQRMERRVEERVERYRLNYNTLSELAAAYTAAQTEAEALEIQTRFSELQTSNRQLTDSLSRSWNYIFDNKSYAYGYLLDKLGYEKMLNHTEEQVALAAQQLSALRGQTVSDEIVDYYLRKRVLLDYEQRVADKFGLTAARDSLSGVAKILASKEYRLPKISIEERLFIDYDSLTFTKTPKYSYQNPIPECKVYARGTIYRILLGRFNTKRAVATFRGAHPLCYLIDSENKWCYYTGGFATLEEAEAAQALLKKRGFIRPEIIVWNDGEQRNITQEGEGPKITYRVEIEGAESLSETVRQTIAVEAKDYDLSRVGQMFVIGMFNDRMVADKLADILGKIDTSLQIKVTEIAEQPK